MQGEMPSEWREKDHYHFRVAWLQPHPDYLALDAGDFELVNAEEAQQEGLEPNFELEVHPGWWIHLNVDSGWGETLEESLNAVKSVLKKFSVRGGVLELRQPGERAPTHVSKSQRHDLIGQIMHPRDNPHARPDDGIVREAFLKIGEHALWAWLEHAPFRDEFEAAFGAPENPLRSLVGRECVLHGLHVDDYEKEERPWQELARGVLELEGTTVRVGGWSHTFTDDEAVFGDAFEEASLESAALQMSLSFDAVDTADTPADTPADTADTADIEEESDA